MHTAFDSTGRHYDETGNFTEWWDVATVQAFEAKTKCFVDQYHEFTVPGLDGKPLHVNGRLTLGENIADAGGLSASFQAWKKREAQKATQKLPGLQQFSKEQLFFMSYASWWCGKTRKEAAVDGIYRDPHSPKWARILVSEFLLFQRRTLAFDRGLIGDVPPQGTMANSREFRESFGCEVKEPTCELW
jgi:endothelin-converting enzyme